MIVPAYSPVAFTTIEPAAMLGRKVEAKRAERQAAKAPAQVVDIARIHEFLTPHQQRPHAPGLPG